MNEPTTLKAEFRPELHFEVRPLPAVPFRAAQEDEFERLKNRLLSEKLFTNQDPALNAPVRRAANEAAALAWLEAHPLLVFPELFQEKARTARLRLQRQERLTARTAPSETLMVAEAA